MLTADDFRQMWRDVKSKVTSSSPASVTSGGTSSSSDGNIDPGSRVHWGGGVDPAAISFEAGKIFAKFDKDSDGKLDKLEFEALMKTYPELMRASAVGGGAVGKGGSDATTPLGGSILSNNVSLGSLPTEVISGRLLTHYDETAGIAIPRSAIEQHRAMGNTVIPLLESYRSRYDRLRGMLTSRLLPRREHLLQLRRQLQHTSTEVAAVRKGIERETMSDAEQIIERLRTVESMRQSAIKHQILQLEEELEGIERIVRRVEQANEDGLYHSASGVLLTSALPGDAAVETVRAPRAASMVELIQQFADINSNIERLASKPLTVQVDFPTTDFPKETAERLEIIARCDRYAHALSVKDHMLWASLQEKEKTEELLAEERRLCHEYAQEVANWAEMAQGLGQQVASLKHERDKLEVMNRQLVNLLREHNIYHQ